MLSEREIEVVRTYRKLGTENRAATVSEAVRLGLIELA
ncbi:DNA-binding NarL/FixJ family response regulator [Streptomyces sp. V4I8]